MKEHAGRAKDLIDIERIKGEEADMSGEAITRRLRQTDQLRELCLSLMKAKKEHDVKAKKTSLNNEKQEKRDV